ncbi:heterokaryon incompatibility protein-domain-containing protein [Xylaria castorea]|nr:heterokaryon incompatibility protein-domain-containing protein [Xylaria castorea]
MDEIIRPYTYEPLLPGEVRLLYYYKDTFDNNSPGWHLKIIQLEPPTNSQTIVPEFDALSYTWGDLTEKFPFLCDARELHVHQNLRDALPFLAERRSTRPIWIDAICINQLDESEKLAQIRLMHRIYRQASKVWVWLGCAIEYSEAGIALLPRLAQVGRSLDQHPVPRWTTTPPNPESVGLPSRDSPIWAPVQRIVCNDWFRRVWAVQEFALARDVAFLYGYHEIHTTVIEDAVAFGYRLEALRDTRGLKLPIGTVANSRGMVRIRRLVAIEGLASIKSNRCIPNHLLGTLVYMTESHECSEPRDRILGILGFLEGYEATKLTISDETSVVELYTEFSHYILTHTDQSQIHWWKLFDRGALLGKRAGLPSWCVDFHQRQNENARNSICQLGAKSEPPYQASHSQGSVRCGGSALELVMRGTIFDHIKHVHPIAPFPPISIQEFASRVSNTNILMEFLIDVRTFLDAAVASITDTKSSACPDPAAGNGEYDDTVLDIFWRTLIGNTTRQGDYTITHKYFDSFRNTLSDFADLCGKVEAEQKGAISIAMGRDLLSHANKKTLQKLETGLQTLISSKTQFMKFLGPFWICLQNRRLFNTGLGRFGFSSMHIEKGDLLCIFNGASTAHILRPLNDGDRVLYSFLGEAYVHGLMNGEVCNLGLDEQEITLV